MKCTVSEVYSIHFWCSTYNEFHIMTLYVIKQKKTREKYLFGRIRNWGLSNNAFIIILASCSFRLGLQEGVVGNGVD